MVNSSARLLVTSGKDMDMTDSDRFFDAIYEWGKWNGITVIIFLVLFLAQVLIGNFIRWEVGPIPEPAVAADPVAGTAQGWAAHSCFDQGSKKVCVFDRAN
jgi:hypothetical protein